MNTRFLHFFAFVLLVISGAHAAIIPQNPLTYTGVARPDVLTKDYVWSDLFKLPPEIDVWGGTDLAGSGFVCTFTNDNEDLVTVENCGFDAALPYRKNQFRYHINPLVTGTAVLTVTCHYKGEEVSNTITVTTTEPGNNPCQPKEDVRLSQIGGPVALAAAEKTYYISDFFDIPGGWNDFSLWDSLGFTWGATTDNADIVQNLRSDMQNSGGTVYLRVLFTLNNVPGDAKITVWTERNGERRESEFDFSQYYVSAGDDVAFATFTEPSVFNVLANDKMMDKPVKVTLVEAPALGTVTFEDVPTSWSKAVNATYTFTGPEDTPNWSSDSFRYRVTVFTDDAMTEEISHAEATVEVTLRSNPTIARVWDFLPAPGQFTNEHVNAEQLVGAWGNNDDNGLESRTALLSLGSFGGYVILGFDSPIYNDPRNPYGVDFTIGGNAFVSAEKGHWTEPGAVMVSRDDNGDGIPNDTWYELAGSEYWWSDTRRNVTVTYHDPGYAIGHDVLYSISDGRHGMVMANNFHKQQYFPNPSNYPAAATDDGTLSYTGTIIGGIYDRSNPRYIEGIRALAFGYMDNHVNCNNMYKPRNPYFDDENGSVADGFDISWAVDAEGNYVELDHIDFVKVYNASIDNCGWLGESSAEISAFCASQPDPAVAVEQKYYINWSHTPQMQIIKGQTCQLEGFAFCNGRPLRDLAATWTSSDPIVGTIDANGLFTAGAVGKTTITFKATDQAPADRFDLRVVELSGVVIPDGNGTHVDRITVYEGESYCLSPESETTDGDIVNGSRQNRFIYDTYTWTSSAPEVVEVAQDGFFTAKAVGEAVLTATSKTNTELSATVTVAVQSLPEVGLVANYVTFDQSNWDTQEELNAKTIGQDRIFSSGNKTIGVTLVKTLPAGHDDKFFYRYGKLGNRLVLGDFREYLLTFETTFNGVTRQFDVPVIHAPGNSVPQPGVREGKLMIDPETLTGSVELEDIFAMETIVPQIYTREYRLAGEGNEFAEGITATVDGSVLTVSVSDASLVTADLAVTVESRTKRISAKAGAALRESTWVSQNTWTSATLPVELNEPSGIGRVESGGAPVIFPNPAVYSFTLDISEPTDIELYSAGGARVASLTLRPGQAVDVRNLNAGVYFVVLPQKRVTLKLIKE